MFIFWNGGNTMSKGQVRDVNIRKMLTEDLNNSKRNLQSVIEELPTNAEDKDIDSIQRLVMEIKNLDKKVSLSNVGTSYKMMDENPSSDSKRNRELRTFDKKMTERSSLIAKATSILYDRILDEDIDNLKMELSQIRKYVVELRNDIEKRDDIIKGVH